MIVQFLNYTYLAKCILYNTGYGIIKLVVDPIRQYQNNDKIITKVRRQLKTFENINTQIKGSGCYLYCQLEACANHVVDRSLNSQL